MPSNRLFSSLTLLAALAAAVLAALTAPPTAAQQTDAREQLLKAAFIYNFVQFTEWPAASFPSPDAPLTIGVVAEPAMAAALDAALKGKKVNGRDILVKRFPASSAVEPCHVLFVGYPERDRLPELLARGQSALVIGDWDRFTSQGGVIRFLTEENKLRFEINLAAAEQRHLKFSAKLLKLARIYQG